jgi:hypothetical protein
MRFVCLFLIFFMIGLTFSQIASHKLISLDNFQPQQLAGLLSGDWKQLLMSTFSQLQLPQMQYQQPQHQSFENIFKRHFIALSKQHLERHRLSL